MSNPVLYIGNKNYSSWSMRPWLALTWAGVAFEERMIPLGGPGYGKSRIAAVLAVSDSGRVPALHVGDVRIHDSLAIMEWAHEQAPEAGLYPRDAILRALARAAAAEMHAGFAAIRNAMSMNIRRRMKAAPAWSDEVKADLARLFELWGGLRARHAQDGPYLFGARGIVDAMYAPMATRLRTYAVEAPAACQAYCDTIFDDDGYRAWEAGALAEPQRIASTDELYP
ncbi:MAG: glutathione S-transferase [Alphaproteobacteria bacterium]|nr:glutathione S-transferase [Alphaproteobacteria bacterium]